jgi:hypothetical protein
VYKENLNRRIFAVIIVIGFTITKRKDTDKIASRILYKFHEFSDIPFSTSNFQNNGRYLATCQQAI